MKFVHLINVRWYNASAWYGVSLARVLAESGHDVIVFGLPDSPPLREARSFGLPVVEAPLNSSHPYALHAASRVLRSCLRTFRPDYLVAHRGEFFWHAALLRAAGRVPHLIRVRADIRPPKRGPLNRWLHLQCDGIVVPGRFMEATLTTVQRIPADRLVVLHGGVDTRVFHPKDPATIAAVRARLDLPASSRLAGAVGRFSPVKGHAVLFRALRECRTNVCLAVAVKDEGDVPAVKALAESAGVADRVRVLGNVANVAGFMASLDVGVVSSLGSEAVCRVAMEMMACGTPVISSDVGVLPEIVPRANVYPARDSRALAGQLDRTRFSHPPVFDERDFGALFLERIASLRQVS
jgi:glycosyltransferase involved in cell wall biosynthesis